MLFVSMFVGRELCSSLYMYVVCARAFVGFVRSFVVCVLCCMYACVVCSLVASRCRCVVGSFVMLLCVCMSVSRSVFLHPCIDSVSYV